LSFVTSSFKLKGTLSQIATVKTDVTVERVTCYLSRMAIPPRDGPWLQLNAVSDCERVN